MFGCECWDWSLFRVRGGEIHTVKSDIDPFWGSKRIESGTFPLGTTTKEWKKRQCSDNVWYFQTFSEMIDWFGNDRLIFSIIYRNDWYFRSILLFCYSYNRRKGESERLNMCGGIFQHIIIILFSFKIIEYTISSWRQRSVIPRLRSLRYFRMFHWSFSKQAALSIHYLRIGIE